MTHQGKTMNGKNRTNSIIRFARNFFRKIYENVLLFGISSSILFCIAIYIDINAQELGLNLVYSGIAVIILGLLNTILLIGDRKRIVSSSKLIQNILENCIISISKKTTSHRYRAYIMLHNKKTHKYEVVYWSRSMENHLDRYLKLDLNTGWLTEEHSVFLLPENSSEKAERLREWSLTEDQAKLTWKDIRTILTTPIYDAKKPVIQERLNILGFLIVDTDMSLNASRLDGNRETGIAETFSATLGEVLS